ncbi:MAG: DUF3445 domain-containing protein [Verrucomicrobia bacterium]|nr:DUF3445 domain-containing protein [Verrucomicrobiota bacterium]
MEPESSKSPQVLTIHDQPEAPSGMAPWTWSDLFPEADYRFNFQFKRGLISSFYQPSAPGSFALRERARLLTHHRADCLAWLPSSEGAIVDAHQVFADLGFAKKSSVSDPTESLLALGQSLEADLILLQMTEHQPVVIAGVACFPTGWSLPAKLGRSLLGVHHEVPELNEELGSRIHRFLSGLKSETSWERANWGLAATSQLNLNPSTFFPRLTAETPLEEIYVRVETQSLTLLPTSAAILFGIRIHLTPLVSLWSHSELRQRIQRAVRTLPPALADYKGLTSIRAKLIEY